MSDWVLNIAFYGGLFAAAYDFAGLGAAGLATCLTALVLAIMSGRMAGGAR